MTIPKYILLPILPAFLIFVFNSCAVEERVRSNLHDPLTILTPAEWAPSNLTAIRLSSNEIVLNWEYDRDDISGFKIDRKTNDGEWHLDYGVIEQDLREWKDASAIVSDAITYHYKLYAYASNNSSSDLVVQLSDSAPQSVDIISVTYDLEQMTVSWNRYSNDDFFSYVLLWSEVENGVKTIIDTITNANTDTYGLSEFDPTVENWFWVQVTDQLGLTVVGNGLSNEIDSPPTPPDLYPVTYQGSTIILSWSQNNDNDFQSYHLYESETEDMSDLTKIFTSENNTDTTYNVSDLSESESRYFHVVVQDVWGLESISNIGMGSFYYRFKNAFGGSSNDVGESVQQTADGGYIITGSTESSGNGEKDVWLIKTDNEGNLEWDKTFGGANDDIGYSVVQTNFGGYIITGSTESFGNGGKDVWLIKTDSQGNEDWSQTFGDSHNDGGEFVQQTVDGGFILAGWTDSYGDGITDAWLIKTNSNGGEEWSQTFGGNTNTDVGLSVNQLNDGGYIVTGYTDSPIGNGGKDAWLYKTDSQGNVQLVELYGGPNDDIGYSVRQASDGGYIFAGYTESFGNGGSDIWLIKTDSDCIEEWSQSFGGSNDDYGESVRLTNDGGYVVAGWTNSYGNGNYDVWLIKINSNGGEEWSQNFGGSNTDIGKSIRQTVDGGFIIAGLTNSYGNGNYDVWIIKTDPEGNSG